MLRYPNIARTDPAQEILTRTPRRTNDEFGIKSELLDGKLTLTVARFDTMDNDATRPNTNASAPGGQEIIIDAGNRAKGWEVEFYGSPFPRLTVIGGYAYTETSTVTGAEFRGVPRDKFQVFGAYDLRTNSDRGWRIKGGAIYQTSVWGRSERNYRIPGGTQVDVGAVGVAAPRFTWQQAFSPAGWFPLGRDAGSEAGASLNLGLIGRLQAGTNEAQAKADLDPIAAHLAAEFPAEIVKRSVYLRLGLDRCAIHSVHQTEALILSASVVRLKGKRKIV